MVICGGIYAESSNKNEGHPDGKRVRLSDIYLELLLSCQRGLEAMSENRAYPTGGQDRTNVQFKSFKTFVQFCSYMCFTQKCAQLCLKNKDQITVVITLPAGHKNTYHCFMLFGIKRQLKLTLPTVIVQCLQIKTTFSHLPYPHIGPIW